MVGARSFAFVVNRAVDKEIDARNPRTAGRAIPAGLVKAWELWVFSAVVLAAYLFARVAARADHALAVADPARWRSSSIRTRSGSRRCATTGSGSASASRRSAAGSAVGGADRRPGAVGARRWRCCCGPPASTSSTRLQDIECDVRDGVHSMPADFGIAQRARADAVAHVLTVAAARRAAAGSSGAGWPWYAGSASRRRCSRYENAIVQAGRPVARERRVLHRERHHRCRRASRARSPTACSAREEQRSRHGHVVHRRRSPARRERVRHAPGRAAAARAGTRSRSS